MGGYLLTHDGDGTEASLAESPSTPTDPVVNVPQPYPPQTGDWRGALIAESCAPPCSGGQACEARPSRCTSGLTCIPGSGAEQFAADESWMLHLSAVQEVGATGQLVDPCQTQKDFWVCQSGTGICVAQTDACAHAGKSAGSIPVTGAQLDHIGIGLDVRVGGPTGPVIATTSSIRNLRRGGLCRGFAVGATGGGVAKVSYFVLPF